MTDERSPIITPVLKDDEKEGRVPDVWRSTLARIVKAILDRDYQALSGVPGVSPLSAETIRQIEDYIEDYGETLVELPQATWESSVYIWMGGHWDVLVDLWTEAEGRSDLVLSARVTEGASGYGFDVGMVYVP